jgi:hypothetical protein
MIYARGADRIRLRLYRMGINNYFSEIIKDFQVYGMLNGTWQLFKKGVDYEAFLVKRKK